MKHLIWACGLVALPVFLNACVDSRLKNGVEAPKPVPSLEPGADTGSEDLSSGVFAPPPITGSPVPLFQSHEIVQVELTGDFPRLNQRGAVPGRRSRGGLVLDEGGPKYSMEIELSTRADVARGSRGCDRLPIVIHLPANRLDTILQNLRSNELVLVTHCKGKSIQESSPAAQQLFGEYLLHRMLGASGLPHYRTRLANVTYRNLDGNVVQTAFGFFQEPSADLAARYAIQTTTQEQADQLLKLRDARYRITSEIAAQLAALPESFELEVFGGPGRGGMTLALPQLSLSELLGRSACRASCWRDGEFFQKLMVSRIPSEAKWRMTVLRELRRIASTRNVMLETIRSVSSSWVSSTRYRIRAESFYDTLDRFLASHQSEE